MGYYIRVLNKYAEVIPVSTLEDRLRFDGISAKVTVIEGNEQAWDRLELSHTNPDAPSDGCIAVIEKNVVSSDSFAEAEIEEFIDELEECKPDSAAQWLRNYLPLVKVIYSFRIIHDGAEWVDGWNAIHAIQGELWGHLGGILQANSEGFTNEDGYHILWQFSEDVTGPWNMAVLNQENNWVAFEMDLGNGENRKSFLEGKIPRGAKRL